MNVMLRHDNSIVPHFSKRRPDDNEREKAMITGDAGRWRTPADEALFAIARAPLGSIFHDNYSSGESTSRGSTLHDLFVKDDRGHTEANARQMIF